MCVFCIKEACMYTLRYTYENSMIVTNYLLNNSNGESNVKVYCKIKIGTWYNAAFIKGFFSNPMKSLVRFWTVLLRNNMLLVLDCSPIPNILVKSILASWLNCFSLVWILLCVFNGVDCLHLFTLFAAEWLITSMGSHICLRLPEVEHL